MENINTCLIALLNNYMRQCMETAPKPRPAQLSTLCVLYLCLGGGVKGAESPCPCDKLHVGWEHSEEVSCSGRDWRLAAFGCGSWAGVRAVRPVFSVTVVITSGFRCFRNIQIFTWRHPKFSSQNASTLRNIGYWAGRAAASGPKPIQRDPLCPLLRDLLLLTLDPVSLIKSIFAYLKEVTLS